MTQSADILGVKFTKSSELYRLLTVSKLHGYGIAEWIAQADLIVDLRKGKCIKNRWYDASTSELCPTLMAMFEVCPLQTISIDGSNRKFTLVEM